jgi:hypothetical protein
LRLHSTRKLLLIKTFTRFKRLPKGWEKVFAIHLSDRGLITRIYRRLKNSPPNNQHPNEEMDTGIKWVILKRGGTNGK